MDWNDHLRQTAQHIAWMARNPGFADHARYRLRELRDSPDGGYEALAEMVKQELAKEKADAE